MALDYRIDTANRIVTITGDYTDGAGWREMLSAVAADPDYRRGFGFLRDVRASEHPVDAATVIGIIAVVREFWDVLGVRRAAILTRRTVDNPAVMAHALAEQEELALRAFNSYDEALQWLRGE
jgi:hypothetical protein